MTKQERQKAILALLQEKGELHVQTICRSFHIVAMTARRDLMELEQMEVPLQRKRKPLMRRHRLQSAVSCIQRKSGSLPILQEAF
ncbi:MAG: DeoR family transcriptional regulator [[Clostridium] innocuum]|nr:DeoR family transcriptional regulator [[Clostridium] innocuum]